MNAAIEDDACSRSHADGDRDARAAITADCRVVTLAGHQWYDMESTQVRHLDDVTDALLWLEERGAETVGFRVIRNPVFPGLIRFEDRP